MPVLPINIAKRNMIIFKVRDFQDFEVKTAGGHKLTIIGEARFTVKFDMLQYPKVLTALICKEVGEEILVDLETLIKWTIIPADFTLPTDPRERAAEAKVHLYNPRQTK